MRWIVSILLLLAGIATLMMALGQALALQDQRQLFAAGAQAEGTVTEQAQGRKSSARFYSYRFRAGDRDWVAKHRDIPFGASEIPVGAKVPVRYDPANPARSVTAAELEDAEGWANRLLFPVIGVALIAAAVVRMVRKPRAK